MKIILESLLEGQKNVSEVVPMMHQKRVELRRTVEFKTHIASAIKR